MTADSGSEKTGAEAERGTTAATPASGPPAGSKAQGFWVPALTGLIVGTVFISVFLFTAGSRTPHGLDVTVVGSASTAAQIAQQLDAQRPGGFDVTAAPDEAEALGALDTRTTFGVYTPGDDVDQLIVAGANGQGANSTMTAAFSEIAQAEGRTLAVEDRIPVSGGDPHGLAVFYVAFGVVLSGFLFGQISLGSAPRLSLGRRFLSLGVFGLLTGVVVTMIAGPLGFGAIGGNPVIMSLVTVLIAFAVGAATLALMQTLKPVGSTVAAILLLIIGNAIGGGSLPIAFLPEWLQPVSGLMPAGAGIRALKGESYFDGDGVVIGIVVLAIWAAVSAGLLCFVDRRRARRQDGPALR